MAASLDGCAHWTYIVKPWLKAERLRPKPYRSWQHSHERLHFLVWACIVFQLYTRTLSLFREEMGFLSLDEEPSKGNKLSCAVQLALTTGGTLFRGVELGSRVLGYVLYIDSSTTYATCVKRLPIFKPLYNCHHIARRDKKLANGQLDSRQLNYTSTQAA